MNTKSINQTLNQEFQTNNYNKNKFTLFVNKFNYII